VLACLRSARFLYPDGSGSIVVELRRHHDLNSNGIKEFLVTRRLTMSPTTLITKAFGTLPEAIRHWDLHVAVLTDKGMERRDDRIVGFHEEG